MMWNGPSNKCLQKDDPKTLTLKDDPRKNPIQKVLYNVALKDDLRRVA